MYHGTEGITNLGSKIWDLVASSLDETRDLEPDYR